MLYILFTYTIIAALFSLYYAFMVLYYLLGWQTTSNFKASSKSVKAKACIIVPARNEQKNIIQLLTCLQQQNFPNHLYDVIIVDDHSNDATPELVEQFSMKNLQLLHLKHFVTENEIAFKKRAIEIAIQHTDAELIITTDADCIMGKKWLYQIVSFYEQTNSQFIVAPVDYYQLNTVLKKLQDLDFLSIMAVTAASVKHKMYNLSNGANMAYTRKAFEQVNGYDKVCDSPSGDDVFLIEKIGKRYPNQIHYLRNKEAIVYTAPCENIGELIQQRMRWISKTKYYTNFTTKLIGYGFLGFYFTFLISLIGGFFSPYLLNIFLIQLFLKLIVDFALLEEVTRFFQRRKLLYYYPLLQLVHLPFTFLISISGQLFKYKWKDRVVNT